MNPEYTSLESLFIPRQRLAPKLESLGTDVVHGRRALPASVTREIYAALVEMVAFGRVPVVRVPRHRK